MPVLHLLITDGISYLLNEASLLWLILMGILYITGAVLYATRTPEKCFPGKFDLWVCFIIIVFLSTGIGFAYVFC